MSLTEILNEVEKLTNEERQKLISVLQEAQQQSRKLETNSVQKRFVSFADAASQFIGKHDSGVIDLASNKKHLEGLGRE